MRRRGTSVLISLAMVAGAIFISVPGPAGAASVVRSVSLDRHDDPSIAFRPVGTYETELVDIGEEVTAAETVASWGDRLYVTNASDNSMDVVDWSDPTDPSLIERIDLSPYGAGPNSVAAGRYGVVVAVEADPKTDPGSLLLVTHEGAFVAQVMTGALPDMVTLTTDDRLALVANEGEPSEDYTVDPPGSITIVDLKALVAGTHDLARGAAVVTRTIDFSFYDEPGRLPDGVRVFGPGALPSQDLEPEYITVSPGDWFAFVSLQEANALAKIPLRSWRNHSVVPKLLPLGTKDHSVDGRGLDPSDDDGAIAIGTWPVEGMYQPDAISALAARGRTWIVSANEGDTRDWDGFSEEVRIGDAVLDPDEFPGAQELQDDAALGRLVVTSTGDADADGDLDRLLAFGGRSFSIWDPDGRLVWDSGDALERITAAVFPDEFNADNLENGADDRSDNKGPEPEGIETATVRGRKLVFVGLERIGGVVIFDVTDPTSPRFVQYTNNRDFLQDPGGDLGPEVLRFVAPREAPNRVASLLVANEVSGTVTIYQVHDPDGAGSLTLLHNNDGESSLLPLTNDVGGTALPIGGVGAFARVTANNIADARDAHRGVLNVYAGDAFLASSTLACSLPPNPPDAPVYDALAQRLIPYDAHILGNHEFDFSPDFLERFIRAFEVNGVLTQPFLSANLDFAAEPGFADLIDPDGLLSGLSTNGRVVARSAIITDEVDGQRFGVVGATTPELPTISSPRDVELLSSDLPSTATVVQAEIDRLRDRGVRKIVFVSHLQDVNNDVELVGLLRHVDVAVAGGGDELLVNDAAQTLPGELAPIAGTYPLLADDLDGRSIPLVTTAGNYKYLGRIDLRFDGGGDVTDVETDSFPRRVIPQSDAATALGIPDAVAPDPALVEQVTDPLQECLAELQTPIAGTDVPLDVSRDGSRGRETNAGNLITDAYLAAYDTYGPSEGLPARDASVIAIQNGGGIRQNAGDILPTNGTTPGFITRQNTLDVLAFLTNVMAVVQDVSPQDLNAIFERSVSSIGGGQFLQVAGVEVVFDLSQPAQVIETDGTVTTEGQRVVSVTLADGTEIVQDGEIVAGAPDVAIVTNSFTAAGGDNFPWLGANPNLTVLPATYEQAWVEFLLTFPASVITASIGSDPAVITAEVPTVPGTVPDYQPDPSERMTFIT
jgi:2',3'-cyclic-nucleotide 2'-phosphodiesterase / 3'-nucleotidase / 5'-nucleotidase